MPNKLTQLTGQTFDRLTVLNRERSPDGTFSWLCLCSCGSKTYAQGPQLTQGRKKSCGCYRKEATGVMRRTHGLSQSRVYNIWNHMQGRCFDESNHRYPLYGGRGISVCDRWMSFSNFVDDMGHPPAGQSLDRIDVDGNYEPSNCKWSTQREQTRNKRNTIKVEFNGETKSLADWCEQLGLKYSRIRDRLQRFGWSADRAMTTP